MRNFLLHAVCAIAIVLLFWASPVMAQPHQQATPEQTQAMMACLAQSGVSMTDEKGKPQPLTDAQKETVDQCAKSSGLPPMTASGAQDAQQATSEQTEAMKECLAQNSVAMTDEKGKILPLTAAQMQTVNQCAQSSGLPPIPASQGAPHATPEQAAAIKECLTQNAVSMTDDNGKLLPLTDAQKAIIEKCMTSNGVALPKTSGK